MNSPEGTTSLLRTYRDAIRASKQTSRTTNALWYRNSSEMPVQWHLSIDGDTLVNKVWREKTNSWSDGPDITLDQLHLPPEHLSKSIVSEILKGVRGKDKRALGIVLHLHNTFQLSEIRSEFSEVGEEFSVLEELVRLAPGNALSGRQIDTNAFSYALLPFWGIAAAGRNAVALQTTNIYCSFVEQITLWGEANNIPVKVSVTAAPLEALSLFDRTSHVSGGETPRDGRIIIFRSRATSFIAVLNREDELLSARIVANQKEDGLPLNLKQLLVTCATGINIESPAIALFDLTGSQSAALIGKLKADGIDLIENTSDLPVEFYNTRNSPEKYAALGNSSISENQTFSELRAGWAKQNLYSLECQDPSRYPTQSALQILKVSRLIRAALTIAVPVAIGWCAMSGVQKSKEEYWKVKRIDVVASTDTLAKLNREKKEILYWENLMASRSEGWIPLAAILDLFPEDKGILLTDFGFNFFALPAEKRAKHLPMRQTWRAKGHATTQGMQYLVNLSSKSNLLTNFDSIAEWSESSVYQNLEATRSLRVVLDQKHEAMGANSVVTKAVARHFFKGFEVEIFRDFSDKDDIALVVKTPSNAETEEQK